MPNRPHPLRPSGSCSYVAARKRPRQPMPRTISGHPGLAWQSITTAHGQIQRIAVLRSRLSRMAPMVHVRVSCLSPTVRLCALPHSGRGADTFVRQTTASVLLPNVPIMVRLETSESPALFAGLPGQLPLVTYFQGGARATVRTLCQTSAAWIPVRLKRDFLLAIRYVGNTARVFSDKSFAPANFSVRAQQQP